MVSENILERITFYIGLFIAAFMILAVVLIIQVLLRRMLRRRLRSLIARDSSHDLVGRTARVARTVRPNRAGQIRILYRGQEMNMKALADTRIRTGVAVRIISVSPDGFRVIPLETAASSPSLQSEQPESLLRRSVVLDSADSGSHQDSDNG